MGPGSVLSFGERLGHRGDTLLLALETPGFPLLCPVIPRPVCSGRRAPSAL